MSKVQKALLDSITHWTMGVDGVAFADEEALCRSFFENECEGCPIRERTRLQYCENTPAIAVIAHVEQCEECAECLESTCQEFKILAQKHVEFLKTLVEEEDA